MNGNNILYAPVLVNKENRIMSAEIYFYTYEEADLYATRYHLSQLLILDRNSLQIIGFITLKE